VPLQQQAEQNLWCGDTVALSELACVKRRATASPDGGAAPREQGSPGGCPNRREGGAGIVHGVLSASSADVMTPRRMLVHSERRYVAALGELALRMRQLCS